MAQTHKSIRKWMGMEFQAMQDCIAAGDASGAFYMALMLARGAFKLKPELREVRG